MLQVQKYLYHTIKSLTLQDNQIGLELEQNIQQNVCMQHKTRTCAMEVNININIQHNTHILTKCKSKIN